MAGSILGGHHRSTVDVCAAVANELTNPAYFPDINEPLADLPLHLIGHSRGGSLVSEIARDLGTQGVWVDQVTTLDSHPVNGTHTIDQYYGSFGDATTQFSQNTVFFDNYYETSSDLLTPTGDYVPGALNDPQNANPNDFAAGGDPTQFAALLQTGTGQYTGIAADHYNVHLWYAGTISTNATDGIYTPPASWYTSSQLGRQTGFYYSLIDGGPSIGRHKRSFRR